MSVDTDTPLAAEHSPEHQTPLMRQYWELKAQAGSAWLFFRMGDFYELFGSDAVAAAPILGVTLTSRDKGKPGALPMAGVPAHSVQGYLKRALDSGQAVALADQLEDPEEAVRLRGSKAIVRREIVRVFTPAIQFEGEGEPRYLATLVAGESISVLALDPATGDTIFGVLEGTETGATPVLERLAALPFKIAHLVLESGSEFLAHTSALQHEPRSTPELPGVLIDWVGANWVIAPELDRVLQATFGLTALSESQSLGLETPARKLGWARLGRTLLRSQRLERLTHVRLPRALGADAQLRLGYRAAEHLELGSVVATLDRTRSAAGARQLKRWLYAPLTDRAAIGARANAAARLARATQRLRDGFAGALGQLYDLERLAGRISSRLATPRDLEACASSFAALQGLSASLRQLVPSTGDADSGVADPNAFVLSEIARRLDAALDALHPALAHLDAALVHPAPTHAREGGVFARGYRTELDRLIELTERGSQWLVDFEARERTATGITSLKVKYSRVFGYAIEVTSANLASVPPHYVRRQTMAGGERFVTDELKRYEEDLLSAVGRRHRLERELFDALLESANDWVSALQAGAQAAAELDALLSFARWLHEPGWCVAEVSEDLAVDIEALRHPVVDQAMPGRFVPNSWRQSAEQPIHLITGPNMGGKSTYLRQLAIAVVLAQSGHPLPARSARLGWFSSVHTRIGAHDAIARGQSTFMVEMSELSQILKRADARSLVVLDEIGRGTSTYDGMSVAWASLEWLVEGPKPRTFFATHYHELTALEARHTAIRNWHTQVARDGESGIRFLYEIAPGAASDSFGIVVAQMAGLPSAVIERSWQVLAELESARSEGGATSSSAAPTASATAPTTRARPTRNAAAPQLSLL